MALDTRQHYQQRYVLDAERCDLVILLYRSAIECISTARQHLGRGEIRERSRELTRASEIINELALSVDHNAGGEIARNLVELYAYLQNLLQVANHQQIEQPLTEAQRLLQTLLEAWESCAPRVDGGFSQYAEPTGERVPLSCVG